MKSIDGNVYFRNEIKNIYPYLSYNTSEEVIIIGGGISGLITAYYLAKEGSSISIFEKNIIGYGISSCSLGIIDSDISNICKYNPKEEVVKISKLYESAKVEFLKLCEEIGYTDIKYAEKIEYTNKFMQKSNMQKEVALKNSYCVECEIVDNISYLNQGSSILFKEKILVINPYEFISKLAKYLNKSLNVRIFENTEIVDIDAHYDYVKCITNNNFKISCEKLIFCIGNEILNYVDSKEVELIQKYTIVTKPQDELKEKNIVLYNLNDNTSICRSLGDGSVMFSSESIKYNIRLSDVNYAKMMQKEKYTKLVVSINKILDVQNYANLDSSYSYVVGKTYDELPLIDEIECMTNCFVNEAFDQNTVLSSIIGAGMLKNAIKGLFTKEMKFFRINRSNCN